MLTAKDDVDYDLLNQFGGKEANAYTKAKFGEEIIDGEMRVTIFHYKDKVARVRFEPYSLPDKSEKEGLRMISFPKVSPEVMKYLKVGTWNRVKELINTL